MKFNFALTGASGYIAPRHMKAIHDTGNSLVACIDPHDSVGVLDKFFFETRYFQEFERFDRYVEKLRRKGEDDRVHYVSICSPNYLHDAHIRFALRVGAHAVCEKPLVINPWNIDPLIELQEEYGKKIFTILQLRLHPALRALKTEMENLATETKREVNLTYITGRGNWYLSSWKGQIDRSGGLSTNIGIHFFDLLMWLFGAVEVSEVHFDSEKTVCGYLELRRAKVKWFLSIDQHHLPEKARLNSKTTFRSIEIDGKEIEFSEGFTDLHTETYRSILSGNGHGPADARPSIELVYNLRNLKPIGKVPHSHDFFKQSVF
jgi:UDP-N-acetyl-2-amino-2-deoxyglucuronate dehydrogenase